MEFNFVLFFVMILIINANVYIHWSIYIYINFSLLINLSPFFIIIFLFFMLLLVFDYNITWLRYMTYLQKPKSETQNLWSSLHWIYRKQVCNLCTLSKALSWLTEILFWIYNGFCPLLGKNKYFYFGHFANFS